MITEFIFMVGLPGCGKSTRLEADYHNVLKFSHGNSLDPKRISDETENVWASTCNMLLNVDRKNGAIVVSADEIKHFLNGYTNEHPETVHQESVKLARKLVEILSRSDRFSGRVVMDGGGINNHYTSDIITYVREHSKGVKIKCIFFDTPIEVCLERIKSRDRKVPLDDIYEKNLKLVSCINRYIPMVDEFERVSYFTNKYLLLDMDGTIAAYGKGKRDIDGNVDFVNSELFLHLRPNQHVIDYVKAHYDMNNVYIVTACANSVAWDEKNQWLDKYFPEIPKENRTFCGNKDYKHVFIKHFAIRKKWKLNEICLVDDYHATIDKCKNMGINCIHPSNIDSLTDKYAFFS